MLSEWCRVRLADLGRIVTGRTPPGTKPEFFGGDVPFLTPTDMDGRRRVLRTSRSLSSAGAEALARVIVPHGVAISCIGWQMGKAVLVTGETATNQQINTVVADSSVVDELFLYYALRSRQQEIFDLGAGGSRTPILNKSDFARFEIELPILPEQHAIAEVLGALDDKIELNERMNATLDEMARALFKSWFVDFDPVRAKAEGQQPSHMDAATAALFPASFEDSPIGPIPTGWRVEAIGNLSEVNGWTLGKNDELETIDYIEISEVSRGNIGSIQRYQRGTEPSRARRRLRHGDTVLSTVRPERGAYFLALNPSPTAIASTGFAVLSPSTAPWSYVHAAMTQEDVFERLGHLADGAAYPAVRPDVVARTPVVWGGEEVGDAFHRQVAPLYELAAHNREESGTLAELRDTLLPRLISGEIRVEATTGIGRAC